MLATVGGGQSIRISETTVIVTGLAGWRWPEIRAEVHVTAAQRP